jgi:hypothetical protein
LVASFPQAPLPVSVLIAPGANPVDSTTFAFTDISSDVRASTGIQIQVGRQDEGAQVDTSSTRLTLDDRSGNYSPRNPLGTWYGKLAKGTPIQVRVTAVDDTFGRVVASGLGTDPGSGQAWTTVGSSYSADGTVGHCTFASANLAANAMLLGVGSDDVDLLKVTSVPAVMTGSAWVDAFAVRYQDINNWYRVHTEFGTGGAVQVKITRIAAGVATDLLGTTSSGITYSAGTKIRTRVQALGPAIRIKVWLDGNAEPAAWTASVTDPNTSVRGNLVGLYEWRVAGNTNAGSLAVNLYEFRCDSIRATTPVPEWPARWNQTGTLPTTPVVGAGILRRLSQGQSALRSPMYRQITQYTTLIGHWPFEDSSGATRLSNTVVGGKAGITSGTTLGASGGPPGASTVAQAATGSVMSGTFKSASATAGWQLSWACDLAAGTPTATPTEMFRWTTSNGYTWSWQVSNTTFRILITANDGTTLLDNSSAWGAGVDPTTWTQYRMKVHASGGTVTVEEGWFPVGANVLYGTTATFSGTVGGLLSWTQSTTALTASGLFSQLYAVTGNTDELQSVDALRSFDGYIGETAGNRITRLTAEEGVPMLTIGSLSSTAAMGAQTSATLLDLLRECEAADLGVLHERGAGLAYLTRVARYNQTPVMVLDFNQGHVADPPEPTDDDQRLRNYVALTRTNGSSVAVQNGASIALNGTYSDELTVNLAYDGDLADQASWRLRQGTADELRWPRISLSLTANPGLIGTWCQIKIGSRITIANPPAAVAGQNLDLTVEGWTETLSVYGWDVELVCSPARPLDVGVYGSSRYDSATTTTAGTLPVGTVGQTGVSLPISIVDVRETWSTVGVPYDVVIAGERVTVTAMTAPAGTGPYTQTATITRGVGGLVKAHVSGEQFSLAAPARYAL